MRTVILLTLSVFSVIEGLKQPLNLEKPSQTFPVHWHTQKLDHLFPLDPRTFQQKYFVNDLYFDGKGPIFLYINGEGPISGPPYKDDDLVVLLAKRHHGYIVTLEHRFYGDSQPLSDWSTPNLRYLSVKQALSDLAHFVLDIRSQLEQTYNREFPIINIGGSYSGALSAWFRTKYPHITKGAVSSSGVVHAILEFTEFDEQVAESVGPTCADAMRNTTRLIEDRILRQGPQVNQQTKALFNATGVTEDPDFMYFVADVMATSVQYDFRVEVCNALVGAEDPVTSFAKYTLSFWVPIFGTAIHYATSFQQNIQLSNQNADRQWWWQTCYELAYFQTAPQENSIRSSIVNITYFRDHCEQVFGIPVWPTVQNTNIEFGGNHTGGSRIFFANGSQDPWRRASVIHTLSDAEPAETVICGNCGHCVDLRGCTGGCENPAALDAVRSNIYDYVDLWLAMRE